MTEEKNTTEEKKDTKVISTRAEQEVADQFDKISEHFNNKNEAMKALLSAYKAQETKEGLIDFKADIDRVQAHTKAIESSFIKIVEAYSAAKTEIAVDFENEITALQENNSIKDEDIKSLKESLKGKDDKIKALQEDLKNQKTEIELLDSLKNQIKDKDLQIDNYREENENSKLIIKDKDEKINTLNDKLSEFDDIFNQKNNEINRLSSDIKVKDSIIFGKDEKITDLKEQISETRALNDVLRVSIDEKDKYIKELNQTLLEQNTRQKDGNSRKDI